GLEGDVIDPLSLELAQIAMQRQRIRSRELAGGESGRGLDPDRSEAGARYAASRPDLSHEGDDRRLAVGPGYCNSDLRLWRKLARRGPRIGRPDIVDDNHRNAGIGHRRLVADHGNGPALDR